MKKLLPLAALLSIGIILIIAAMGKMAISLAIADTTSTAITSLPAGSSTLQQQLDANTLQITTLNQQIATYQAELQKVGADKKTLQAAIKSLDLQKGKVQTQISVTQLQMAATQLQIQQLGGKINDTVQTISTDQAALGEYLRSLQQADDQPLIMQVLGSNTLTQAWSDVNATLQMQGAIQTKMDALQTQKTTLTDSQTASEQKQQDLAAQKAALADQQQSLTTTVQSKSQLLTETNAKESTYQKLLADAQAQLDSFSAFAANAGGSKLIGNQTVCDAWGCYYNQRDTAWGNTALNGTKYKLASDGCLITSVAMVMTHYGYKTVTPVSINSNPNNFASYYPAYLLYTVTVNGISATRKTTTIDATLAAGTPVIVGIHAYGGTHYVVLISGSKGNYIMRDPYIANGKDISFSANYSLRSIFGITKLVIGG